MSVTPWNPLLATSLDTAEMDLPTLRAVPLVFNGLLQKMNATGLLKSNVATDQSLNH